MRHFGVHALRTVIVGDFMKKKMIICLLLAILVICSIIIVAFSNINSHNDYSIDNNATINNSLPNINPGGGVGANPSNKEFFDFLTKCNKKAIKYMEDYYSLSDSSLYIDGVFHVSLLDIIDKGADFTELNSDKYSCKIDSSYVEAYLLDDGTYNLSSWIDCTN